MSCGASIGRAACGNERAGRRLWRHPARRFRMQLTVSPSRASCRATVRRPRLKSPAWPGRPGSPGRARNLSSLRLAHSRVIAIRLPSASTSRGTVRSLRPAEPSAQVAAEVDEQQQERGCKVLDQRAHERCSLFYPYLGKNGRSSQALAGRNFKSFVSS